MVGATSATERLNESGLNSARHLAIFAIVVKNWGVAKWLRRRVLIPVFPGSNPGAPANFHASVLALQQRCRLVQRHRRITQQQFSRFRLEWPFVQLQRILRR